MAWCCSGEEDGGGHDSHDDALDGHDGHAGASDHSDLAVMFHSAPTLMFVAILFHEAFGSPRYLEHASVFEWRS